MGLAIVAIPEEQDRAWEISSEKVPHLTLLFLGDEASADTQTIMQFVEHAATLSEHGPFYLTVERRGTLGSDDADVVFFDKRSWNMGWVKRFRSQLLQNDAIRTAYDSAEQFGSPQEWVPHLTLGYPETPANEPENSSDRHIYSVCFDRIAVWAGQYEGPEFRLEWPDRELEGELAVAYSDTQKTALTHYATNLGISEAEVLEHHGVKGMKWGVRNRKGEPLAVTPTSVSRVPHGNRRKTKIKTEGGQNHPAHEDAVKVAEARVKLKKSGAAALSNKELRDVANRLQLENQVKLLTSSKGKRFVQKQLTNEGQDLARRGAKKAVTKGAKKAASAAPLALL